MTALINKYFIKNSPLEQSLFEKIKTESIKVMGRTYMYLPREVFAINQILGEDVSSKFSTAIEIEMYMEENTGFSGDNEMYGKFGLEIASSYTLVVSKSRWEKEVIKSENEFMLVKNRPQEGDLIFDPMTKFIFEIKFVDHDAPFFEVSKNYVYKLSCEAFQYASESFDTGVEEIDRLEDLNTNDVLNNQITQESGFMILQENGGTLLQDMPEIPDFTSGKDGYDKSQEFEDVIPQLEFSVSNPFASR